MFSQPVSFFMRNALKLGSHRIQSFTMVMVETMIKIS